MTTTSNDIISIRHLVFKAFKAFLIAFIAIAVVFMLGIIIMNFLGAKQTLPPLWVAVWLAALCALLAALPIQHRVSFSSIASHFPHPFAHLGIAKKDSAAAKERARTFAIEVTKIISREDSKAGTADIYTRIAINLVVAGGCERLGTHFSLSDKDYKKILQLAIKKVAENTSISGIKRTKTFYDILNSEQLEPIHHELISLGGEAMETLLKEGSLAALAEADSASEFQGLTDTLPLWRENVIKALGTLNESEGETTLQTIAAAVPTPAPETVAEAAAVAEAEDMPITKAPEMTIMFTDIANSTAMASDKGEVFIQHIFHIHNAVVREALSTFGGKEIKLMGDGVFACFTEPLGAVRAAIRIQRAFAKFSTQHPEMAFKVRIGLNVGSPIIEDGDLYGLVVQKAERICESARPTTIFVPASMHDILTAGGIELEDEGFVALKNIPTKEHLYSVKP